jgi:transposase
LDVLHKIESKKLTGKQAAKQLRMSLRQIRWLIASFREQGALGLVHGNRGRTASNRIADETRARVLELAEKEYQDYNDSHFIEELEEKYGLP